MGKNRLETVANIESRLEPDGFLRAYLTFPNKMRLLVGSLVGGAQTVPGAVAAWEKVLCDVLQHVIAEANETPIENIVLVKDSEVN